MHARARRLAAALQGLGVAKGDAVTVLGPESIEIYEHIFACAMIGAVRVGLNTQYAAAELAHVLADSAAKIAIVDARCAPIMEARQEALETSEPSSSAATEPIGLASITRHWSRAPPRNRRRS